VFPVTERPPPSEPENQRAVPDYLAHEGLEHARAAQEHVEGTSDPFLRYVPVTAAVLAVCAGLSSLVGNRLAEAMLSSGSQAVLAQTQAADLWNEYEADSLKAHIDVGAEALAPNAKVRQQLHEDEIKYRNRQTPLSVEARALEDERTATLTKMDKAEAKKLDMDVATALFQVSIVLASIAAIVKRSPLFIVGIIGGAIGIAFCVVGLLR